MNYITYALVVILSINIGSAQNKDLNIAKPSQHPYVHPEGNRELHSYAFEKVNEAIDKCKQGLLNLQISIKSQ